MGVGVAVFWGSVVVCASVVLVVLGALRINARRKPRDLSDTIDEQIAAAELLCRTELYNAPVIGVPYAGVRSDGSHDLYPHMSEQARDAVIEMLDGWFAAPDAERAA